MPWEVAEGHGCQGATPWAVIKTDTREKVSCHASRKAAEAQVRLLYAKEGSRMTADPQLESPFEQVPAWARPLLPEWVGGLRDRAVALDDLYVDRAAGGDGRTVTAYAAVFNTPAEIHDQDGHYHEQNDPAAFTRTLAARAGKINVFYHHGRTLYGTPSERGSVPLGTPLEITPDRRGLKTVTRYNRTALAEEILEAIKSGSLTGMSFTGAFLRSDPAGPYRPGPDGELTLVTRQEIALIEYGPTPIPAYSDAEVVGVRSQDLAERASDAPWDGGANVARLSNDAGAGTYRKMYAAVREGADPDLKGSWALPHHMVSEDGTVGEANLAGVRNALARLPQTQGLSASAKAAAERHLRGHLPAESPASSSNRAAPAADGDPPTHSPEDAPPDPPAHSGARTSTTAVRNELADVPAQPSGRNNVDLEVQQTMTAQERVVRQGEIRSRMNELANQFNGAELDEESQAEWNRISEEFDVHERAIQADTARRQRLAELGEEQQRNGSGERVDGRGAGYGYRTAPVQVRRPEDLFDLGEIRNRARSLDDLPELYRENAMRAVEQARFPGTRREDAQQRIQELLDGPDAGSGDLARRILVTGSPTYERAFGKWVARGGMAGLTNEEQRALSMGSATSAQLAVPFTLDPTIILTSDGATNPLRAMSRVETITGRAWEGVTSAGVTVTRAAEAAEVGDNAPSLAQPVVTPTRVHGFIPFSIEADQDWSQLRSEMTRLLQDAKDVEEATSFVTGNGTPPNPSGIIATLTTASNVNDGYASFDASDLMALENALPPRFQTRAQWLGRKNTYNLVRALDTNGTLYVRLTAARPGELLGYPANEASAMPTRTVAANRYLVLGDFSQFLIVDKAGMDVELVPHLFHTNNNLPTGQRGLYAIWRNNSQILVGNAFRALVYAT